MKTFRHCYDVLEWDSRLGFYVRSCGYFNLIPPDREKYRPIVDFGEIFWCIRGSGLFRSGSHEAILRPDHIWYYPVGSCHDYVPRKGGFEYRWLSITGRDAAKLFEGLNIPPGISYAGPCPQDLFSVVELNLKNAERTSRMQALAAAFQILTMLSPGQHVENIRGSMAAHAKSLIDSSFSDQEFNVEKVATLLGVHRGSLSMAFSKGYGMTVSHYISSCRVRHAMTLLRETSLPLRDVALQSGFNSQEYFSRVFLKQTSFTPAVYRQHNKKNLSRQKEKKLP